MKQETKKRIKLGLLVTLIIFTIATLGIICGHNRNKVESPLIERPKDGNYRIVKKSFGGYVLQRYRTFPHWCDFIESKGGEKLTLEDARRLKKVMEAPEKVIPD